MRRLLKKRRIPRFRRQRGHPKVRKLGDSWRKPRGIDSKQRREKYGKGDVVKIGYRQPKSVRGLHPSGLPEVLVNTPEEVKKLKNCVVRIAAGVGKRKREEITKIAEKMGLKVVNA